MMPRSFADELRARLAPEHQILYFLKVVGRGIELPLAGATARLSQRVLMVPGMILTVIKEFGDHAVAKWDGPTFECDAHASREKPRFSPRSGFFMDVPVALLVNGDIVRVWPSRVKKMKNHVPAVLFQPPL